MSRPASRASNPSTERQWESYTAPTGRSASSTASRCAPPARPDDIAHAVMFFASDYAGWITGQVLSVSGGK